MTAERVTLVEVGLRDGLQSEAVIVPTAVKLGWVARLIDAGCTHIQVAAFVHPARVPQMADAEAVCAGLPHAPHVQFSGLALNLKGVERAHAAGLACVDLGMSASETHSQKNTGKSLAQALDDMQAMTALAQSLGLRVRCAVQVAFGCVYEGDVPLTRVQDLLARYVAWGAHEVALADSSGMANPVQMTRTLEAVMPMLNGTPLVLHLHDTRGMGLANVYAALQQGVRAFDTSFGGLGGCPFIVGASGNIATEDTAHMLSAMGYDVGVDVGKISGISKDAQAILGRARMSSKLYELVGEGRA
jgi:hydroxymethylglutaryl-CoA lyase